MNPKAIARTVSSVLAALGINTIPAGIVLVGGGPVEVAMVLYFLENLVAIILAAARVQFLAPAHDERYAQLAPNKTEMKVNGRKVYSRRTIRRRRGLIVDYLVISFGLSIATGVFLFVFVLLMMQVTIPRAVLMTGLVGIVTLQLFSFVADLWLLGPLSPLQAEAVLQKSLGRVALLHLAVFVGLFLAFREERWFVLPFAALKTMVDVGTPIQAFVSSLGNRIKPTDAGSVSE